MYLLLLPGDRVDLTYHSRPGDPVKENNNIVFNRVNAILAS